MKLKIRKPTGQDYAWTHYKQGFSNRLISLTMTNVNFVKLSE